MKRARVQRARVKRRLASLGVALLLVASARVAAAACPNLTFESDDPSLIALINDGYAHREDIDTCAHVRLTTRGAQVALAVTLPDGRVAERMTSRAELLTTLEALLRVPTATDGARDDRTAERRDDARDDEAVTLQVGSTMGARGAAAGGGGERDAVVPRAPRRPRIGLELAALSSAQVGAWTAVGAGALGLADVDSGLVGARFRYDQYNAPHGEHAFSAHLLGGKRVRLGDFSLDLLGGFGLKLETIPEDDGVPRPVIVQRPYPGAAVPPGPPFLLYTTTRPEAVFSVRFNARAQSHLRAFLSLDGAASESWSLGLSLGAAVGT